MHTFNRSNATILRLMPHKDSFMYRKCSAKPMSYTYLLRYDLRYISIPFTFESFFYLCCVHFQSVPIHVVRGRRIHGMVNNTDMH